MQSCKTWCVKGVPFVNRKYVKGVPFLSKMVYEVVRDWTKLSTPFPGCRAATPTPCTEGQQIPCRPSIPFSNKG